MPRVESEFSLGLRALNVVLCSHHSLGVSQIAAALGMAKSSTHDLLTRLCATRFLEQHAVTRRYHVGPGIFAFIHEVTSHFGSNALIFQRLRHLSFDHNRTLYVSMLGARHSYVVLASGPLGDAVTLGASSPVEHSSAGKILVAQLPAERWAEFAPAEGPGARGEARRRFLQEIEEAARDGVAWNIRESEKTVCSVAAPILQPGVPSNKAVAIVMRDTEFARHDRRALAAQVCQFARALGEVLDPRPAPHLLAKASRHRR